MTATFSIDPYWEKKVDRYTNENYNVNTVDATILTSMRRAKMQSVEEVAHSNQSYTEKIAKLLEKEKTLLTPATNKSRILASLVPDEVIFNPNNYNNRRFIVALMFVDVSGFTELCENYTTKVEDGASRMTHILNKYIGSMVQEILMQGGDVLKFSGDAFIAMWKTSPKMPITQIVQVAIECGLAIQRNYGINTTDVGIELKVKVSVSAGEILFSIIGKDKYSHWVLVGSPVWDVKAAEKLSQAGDVTVTHSAWRYINENQYVVKKLKGGMFFKITAISSNWRSVTIDDKNEDELEEMSERTNTRSVSRMLNADFYAQSIEKICQIYTDTSLKSFRPSVNYAMKKNLHTALAKFIPEIVLQVVDYDGRLETLNEMRYVIIVFVNIICEMKDDSGLVDIAENVFNIVSNTVPKFQGVLDKLTLFDKDLVCLIVFGLRGLKHELSCQQALSCSVLLRNQLKTVENVYHVSIGVTAGFIYCGLVGNTMRREASVIGMCVNKGARLMVAYLDKITCDKEVFLQSQLPSNYFIHMAYKDLKGFTNVGPVYEYSELENVIPKAPTPLIGRESELEIFKRWLQKALQDYKKMDSRKNVFVIEGQLRVGKTRFLEEVMKEIPKNYRIIKAHEDRHVLEDYSVIRSIVSLIIGKNSDRNKIMTLHLKKSVPENQWHLLNPILGTHFSVKTESITPLEKQMHINSAFINFCTELIKDLYILIVDRSSLIDKPSLSLLFLMLESLPVIGILSVHTQNTLVNDVFKVEMKKSHIEVMNLKGVDRFHHATIICLMMKVDAISSDLEKIVQLFSEGYVSWIEKFIKIMIHSKQLNIVEMTRKEVFSMGAIVSVVDEKKLESREISSIGIDEEYHKWISGWEIFKTSYRVTEAGSRKSDLLTTLRVAVLNPSFKFDDMQIEIPSYVTFLKMYDNMASLEKSILKCSSAMGEIFHIDLLVKVLRAEKEENIIQGVRKLIELEVYELTKYSNFLNSTPRESEEVGDDDVKITYVHFRDPIFFKYAYGLLTANQKKHYHNIAITVLRNKIRKCDACGHGRFRMLLGTMKRDDFEENEAVRRRIRDYFGNGGFRFKYFTSQEVRTTETPTRHTSEHPVSSRRSVVYLKHLAECKCERLLSAMYTQIIRHCKKSGRINSLIEAYMEFTTLKINYSDTYEAIFIIKEADDFVKSDKFKLPENTERIMMWQRNFINGRIASKKGKIMYDVGNMSEAGKYLMEAMVLLEFPFPKNRYMVFFKFLKEKWSQMMLLRKNPVMYVGKSKDLDDIITTNVSETLSYLYDYFMTIGKRKEARLAAIWSFNAIMKNNTDFKMLCIASANMIFIEQTLQNWDLCKQIEDMSSTMCMKMINNFDITEVYGFVRLLTSILTYRIAYGDIDKALVIGHRLIPVLSFTKVDYKLIYALTTLGGILTVRKMFRVMLAFYNELRSVHKIQDFSCKSFYYGGVIDLYLDTNFWVESPSTCMDFFLDNKDRILSNIYSEPGWFLVIGLSLSAIRSKRWETIAEWKSAFKRFSTEYYDKCQFPTILLRFAECQLLLLVLQMEEKNFFRSERIRNNISLIFHTLDKKMECKNAYSICTLMLLKGYYCHINGDNDGMLKLMKKTSAMSKEKKFMLLVDAAECFIDKCLAAKKEGQIYFWPGLNYTNEIFQIKSNSNENAMFSDIVDEF